VATSLFSNDSSATMRANPVNVLCVVAIPAQQPKIDGKSQFDNDGVPRTARYSKAFRLAFTVTPRISTPVALRVVDCQKLLSALATTHALAPIVSENCRLVSFALVSLPFEYERPALAAGNSCVLPRLNLTFVADAGFPVCLRSALHTPLFGFALLPPSSTALRFSLLHTYYLSTSITDVSNNIRASVMALETKLMEV
jgi:hypothetical protein